MKVWNTWRLEQPEICPDLSGADLSDAFLPRYYFGGYTRSGPNISGSLSIYTDFTNSNLRKANFDNADLRSANLSGSNLSEAILTQTTLIGANFSKADLSRAILINAHLNGAHLEGAHLSGANLSGAYLNEANLSKADLSKAVIGWTTIGNVDLRHVRGLETITHLGPSTIGTNTLELSEGDIPEVFLRGAGLSDAFIEYIRSLTSHPFEYYTCFISYSSKDQAFAEQLYADLQSIGVRCWFAPEDMKIGDKIRPRIDEAIRIHDKLLLVLSEYSVESLWVEKEVETAFEKEQQQNRLVLFPIRVDDTVIQTTQAWAADIRRTRHIGDFRQWKNYDDYQKALSRLLRDLKAEI